MASTSDIQGEAPAAPAPTPDARPDATPAAPPVVPGGDAGLVLPGPVAPAEPESLVGRLAGLLKREPVLVVSLVYALVSFMGMWSSYWFYARLGVPILDYLQGSDLFVIGIRRPDFLLVALGGVALAWTGALPQRWVSRNPEKAQDLFHRRPWVKWLAMPPWVASRPLARLYRVENQLVVFGLILALQYLWVWSSWSARDVLLGKGKGQQVRLTLAGDDAPLPGEAQLLGTTSAYVFVWWPAAGKAEALPIANLARLESLEPVRLPRNRPAAATPPSPLPPPAAGEPAAVPVAAPEAAPSP